MEVRRLAAKVLLTLLCAGASADESSDRTPILDVHGWNGSDCYGDCIVDLERQPWLALVPGHGGWTLVPTRLSFDNVETMGIHSSVEHAEFHLSHPALVAGHAETPNVRFKDQARAFYPGHVDPLRFSFHDRRYEFAVEGHELVLRNANRKSSIGVVGGEDYDDSDVLVLWAGDLDGDGEIDAIVHKTNTKNGQLCLLLSSANEDPRALVSEVGCQFFSG